MDGQARDFDSRPVHSGHDGSTSHNANGLVGVYDDEVRSMHHMHAHTHACTLAFAD